MSEENTSMLISADLPPPCKHKLRVKHLKDDRVEIDCAKECKRFVINVPKHDVARIQKVMCK